MKMTAKQKQSLQRIKDMRLQLDHVEKRVRKNQMYSAFDGFDHLSRMAGSAAHNIALETLPAARRYYDVFSIKDSRGKHKEWCAV